MSILKRDPPYAGTTVPPETVGAMRPLERKELILQYKGIIRGSSLPENTLMPILL